MHMTAQFEMKKLVGITVRTSNHRESDPKTAQIGPTVEQYFANNLATQILNRKNPGVTYCVYTDYDSDEHSDYTYFVGEEVESFCDPQAPLEILTIPAQTYTKIPVGPGKMPDICIEAWQNIWTLSSKDLGGDRSYKADFEIYDHRAMDPLHTSFDIYIGLAI